MALLSYILTENYTILASLNIFNIF